MDDKDKRLLFGKFAEKEVAREEQKKVRANAYHEVSKVEDVKLDYVPRATRKFHEDFLLEHLEEVKVEAVEEDKAKENIVATPKTEAKAPEAKKEVKQDVKHFHKPQEQPTLQRLDSYLKSTKLAVGATLQSAKLSFSPATTCLYLHNNMPIFDVENDLGSPTCLHVHKGCVSVGYSSGAVKMMGLNDPNGKVLAHKEVNKKAVIAIDINGSNSLLVAVYKPYTLGLWDLTKMTLLKHVAVNSSDEYLCVRFVSTSKDLVLTSDTSGKVSTVEFSKTMFGFNANTSLLKKLDCVAQLLPLENGAVLMAGSGSVVLAAVEPSPKILWTFSGLNMKKELPYIDLGRGRVPNERESEKVLAIAVGRAIQLVQTPDLANPKGFAQNGYYISKKPLCGVWWVAEGLLAALNVDRELQLLDVGRFKPGICAEEEAETVLADVEPPHKLANPPVPSSIKDKEDRGYYYQSCCVRNKRLVVLSEKFIVYWALRSLNDFLAKEKESKGTYSQLKAIVRMCSKDFKGIVDLPQDKSERESTLRPIFKLALKEFLDEGKSISSSEIPILIELCIEIGAFDYLFGELLQSFGKLKQEDLYIEGIESSILNGIFGNAEIPEEVLKTLVDFYVTKGDIDKLESLLLKFNFAKKDLEYLSKLCVEHKMCLLYIYIRTAGDYEYYYVDPLNLLQEKIDCMREGKSFNLGREFVFKKETESNWSYFAYVMLYYIDLCFKGKMLPRRANEPTRNIRLSMRPKIVYLITNWLFTEHTPEAIAEKKEDKEASAASQKSSKAIFNINDLVGTDLDATLSVLEQLFTNKELRSAVLSFHKYLELAISPDCVKNYEDVLVRLYETVGNFEAKLISGRMYNAFHKFVARVASNPDIHLPAKLCVDTVVRISNFAVDFDKEKDRCKEYEEMILSLLKKHEGKLKKELDKLIMNFSTKRYTKVFLYLMEAKGEYTKCFENIISSKDTAINTQIFTWLDSIHDKLKDNEKDLEDMRRKIRSKFETLVGFSKQVASNERGRSHRGGEQVAGPPACGDNQGGVI